MSTSHDVTLDREDAAQVLNYLDGLATILRHLHERQEGMRVPSSLVDELMATTDDDMRWEPLRYQAGDGLGFLYLEENVRRLVTRLREARA